MTEGCRQSMWTHGRLISRLLNLNWWGARRGMDLLDYQRVKTLDHIFFSKYSVCVKITLPWVRSVDRELIVYNDNEPTCVQTCDDDTSLFVAKPTSRWLRPYAGKSWAAKRSWWCLGTVPSNRHYKFCTINQILEEIHLYRAQDVLHKPLVYSTDCCTCWSQTESPFQFCANFAQGGVERHVVLRVCYTKLS